MNHTPSRSLVSVLALVTLIAFALVAGWQPVSSPAFTSAGAQAPIQDPILAKVDPRLLEALTRDETPDARAGASATSAKPDLIEGGEAVSFWLTLAEQADLSAAGGMLSKEDKAAYVYRMLHEVADRTQLMVRSELDLMEMKHKAFWISNAILVEAVSEQDAGLDQASTADHLQRREAQRQGRELRGRQVLQLAARPDIARVDLAERGQWALDALPTPTQPASTNTGQVTEIAWNIDYVKAPEVWARGFRGQGMVIASIDTGVKWKHEALKTNYRGWKGSRANHNYNWWDGVRDGASENNKCGNASPVPCDDNGHGTHTMGTAAGGDALDADGVTRQIGIAPDAKWMACRGFDDALTVPGAIESCLQFFLAPTDLDGANPNPGKAPDVINHSYGVTDTPMLKVAFDVLDAAGIYNVASAGNTGICNSIRPAPGVYPQVLTVGALSFDFNLGIGVDTIALFSTKGPGLPGYDLQKPNLVAPGQNILSARRNGGLVHMSGTSMSAPLVAGAVALLWDTRPHLRGNIRKTTKLLTRNAFAIEAIGCASPTLSPNYVYGHGRLDVRAAVDNDQ